jgi:hypothetical protein
MFNEHVDPDDRRPGDAEFGIAIRSIVFALLAVIVVQVTSLSTAPTALALTFLLWLAVLLSGARALLAISIALAKRRRR